MRRLFVAVVIVLAWAAPAGAHQQPGNSCTPPKDGLAGETFRSGNVRYLGSLPGEAGDMAAGGKLVGRYFYMSGASHISIYDTADPAKPQLVSRIDFGCRFENEDIAVDGKSLIYSDFSLTRALYVYDVRDPKLPKLVAELPDAGRHTMQCVLDCRYLYGSYSLTAGEVPNATGSVIDLADPANPKVLGDWTANDVLPSRKVHDVNEVAPGIVVAAAAPIQVMDVRGDAVKPKVLGRSPDPAKRFHSVEWPRGGKDRFMMAMFETNATPRCEAGVGEFTVFDATGVGGSGEIKPISSYFLQNTNDEKSQGNPEVNAGLGCSPHWFQVRPTWNDGGIVAMAAYDHGVKFLRVDGAGQISEAGHFRAPGTNAAAAYWVTCDIVYVVDYTRGLDVIRFDDPATDCKDTLPAPPANVVPSPAACTGLTAPSVSARRPCEAGCVRRARRAGRGRGGAGRREAVPLPVGARQARAGTGVPCCGGAVPAGARDGRVVGLGAGGAGALPRLRPGGGCVREHQQDRGKQVRRGVLVGAVVLALSWAAPAAAQDLEPGNCNGQGESAVTKKGPYEILPQEVVEVPSSIDGRPQQIGIVRPKLPAGVKAPVLVHASAYHAEDLTKADIRSCAAFLVENYVPHGYAVALVPSRGVGGSDGCPNLWGKTERADLDTALTWLGTQPWSAGKIAMYGLSYDGSTPWAAAATGNPYLKTILPASGVNDIYDLAFSAGTLDWRFWFFVSGYYHYYGPVYNNPVYAGRSVDRTVNAATTCPDVVQGEAASVESAATGEMDSFGYWAERRLRPMIERNYKGSVLLIQGLQDWNVRPAHTIPWTVSLKKKGIVVEQLLGQWPHAWPDNAFAEPHTRWDFADEALAWFNKYLKGDDDAPTGARVEVEDSSGKWRREKSWPPKNKQQLFLNADGSLSSAADAGSASAVLAQDSRSRHYLIGSTFPAETTDADDPTPRQADDICITCVKFTLPASSKALRISGLPELFATVTPTAPSGHVAAALYRRAADGLLYRLGWGVTDLRFPEGENTGDETPEAVVAGEAKRVRIEFEPLEAVVPPGEELVLILGQGNGMQLAGRPAGPVELVYGDGDAFLKYRRVQPKASQFFTPPSSDGRTLP